MYCIVNILNTTELVLKMDKMVNFILLFIIILKRWESNNFYYKEIVQYYYKSIQSLFNNDFNEKK